MLVYFLIVLFFLGTLFGSFATVLISRWKNWQWGITTGRSQCPKCHHTLSWKELIPLFSWLFQKGKCKYCKNPISLKYPLTEILMWGGFSLAWYVYYMFFWENFFPIILISLLLWIFLTIVYILYDMCYMEIPEEIFIIFIVWQIILFILSISLWYENIYFNAKYFHTFHTFIFDKLFGIFILYTFLFLQIFIPASLYLLRQEKIKDIWELVIMYIGFPFVAIYDFIQYQILKKTRKDMEELDIPTWIGSGDLFLAIIIGMILGTMHGIVAFFFAYIFGGIIGSLMLIGKKILKKPISSEIPFWPFLGLGFLFSLLFYQEIHTILMEYFFFFL